jgi:hypothetical protein
MLTDKEAEEIERKRKSGVSSGPILLGWVDGLLADRKERVRQLQTSRPRPAAVSKAKPFYCPNCGQPYARAYGISPDGIAYVHAGGRECRMGTSERNENSSPP